MNLPKKTKELFEVIKNKHKTIPESSILLTILLKISEVCCYNRVKIKHNLHGFSIYPNLYAITFMPSGSGKDKINKIVNDIFSEFDNVVRSDFKNVLTETTKKANSKKEEKENQVVLVSKLGDGTAEGLVNMASQFSYVGFGCINVRLSEFVDYITANNQTRKEFLSQITEAYDFGTFTTKAIKSSEIKTAKNIPLVFGVHSSLFGLLDKKESRFDFLSFLNRGIARRSLLCYPTKDEYKEEQIDDFQKAFEKEKSQIKNGNEILSKHKKHIQKMILELTYKATYVEKEDNNEYFFDNKKIVDGVVFDLSKEAEFEYFKYQKQCERRAFEIKESKKEGLKAEISSRYWKALRVAGIIACYEHPEVKLIEPSDYLYAIEIVEFFGKYFNEFFKDIDEVDTEKLYKYFVDNLEKDIYKTDLRKLDLKNFDFNFDNYIEEVGAIAERNNMKLTSKNHMQKNKVFILKQLKEESDKVILSTSFDETKMFKPIEIDFFEISKYTRSLHYTNFSFKNGHRSGVNNNGGVNIIIYDIDDGATIAEIEEKLKDYTYLITTSKSHNIEKHGVVRDRFRLFLPLKYRINFASDSVRWKRMLYRIDKHFVLNADKQAFDIARKYQPAKNQLVFENKGIKFDYRVFDVKEETEEKEVKTHFMNNEKTWVKAATTRFNSNFVEGNRNNTIAEICLWGIQENISKATIKNLLENLNNMSGIGVSDRELETIFRSKEL